LIALSNYAQKLKFENTKHNFGYLQRGDIDTMHYSFTNAGDAPLILTSYKVECNCTKVLIPKDPISPGEGGVVTVIFDTKSAHGLQDRVVTIISNSKKGEERLHFKGEILEKKKIGF
jgi:hypothetical protein